MNGCEHCVLGCVSIKKALARSSSLPWASPGAASLEEAQLGELPRRWRALARPGSCGPLRRGRLACDKNGWDQPRRRRPRTTLRAGKTAGRPARGRRLDLAVAAIDGRIVVKARVEALDYASLEPVPDGHAAGTPARWAPGEPAGARAGTGPRKVPMPESKRYTLKVGESAKVRTRLLTSHALIYAGMLGTGVCSVAVVWSCGQNSMAYNLFLSERQREFRTAGGRVVVHRVTPEEIDFSYEP